mgnify:CR=1 FL=1
MRVPSRAAKRYAKALFNLARETGQMDAVRDDLAALQSLALESSELSRFLADTHWSRRARAELLKNLFSNRLQPLSYRFLVFLESKRRLGLLEPICASFLGLHDDMKGIVRGRLTSAFALEPTDVTAISARAEPGAGGALRLDVNVDTGLLGGFKLRVGDVVHDLSLAGQLRALRQRLVYG